MNTLASEFPSDEPEEDEPTPLKERVLESLRLQGFKISEGRLIAPVLTDKDVLRSMQADAVRAQRERARAALARHDDRFTFRILSGEELNPASIRPRFELIEHGRRSDAALLWRWCALHWSVPVSSGYGRRLRFLIRDDAHGGAVIGIVGLADPVFALRDRDRVIGWSHEDRRQRLANVMDAFVLGAVPPYSDLLGGKLIASLLQSDDIRETFHERYAHRTTRISERDPHARLLMITTSSALGRSSIYNRVSREDGRASMTRLGFSAGSGDFHFSGEIYRELAELAHETADGQSHRHESWGSGFRNRREVVQRSLRQLGLSPSKLRVHGIRREVFATRLASNTDEILRGEAGDPNWMTLATDDIATWWKTRWALPRSERSDGWRAFDRETWRLYE